MSSRTVRVPTTLGLVLHTYRTLSYSWPHAIGEMVDNSVDSYLQHKEHLPNGIDIRINYNPKDKTLVIIDTAYGMNGDDMEAAVQLTRQASDYKYYESGIGRYGLGLKKAATFLGDNWKVISNEKDSGIKYTADIDVMKLFSTGAEEVDILSSKTNSKHGTRIEINLRKNMHGNQAKKVQEKLAEMYRFYIQEEEIRIYWNDELVDYSQPEVRTTEVKASDGSITKEQWWSSVEIPVKIKNKIVATVSGEIYILETMSHRTSGIQLFHSNRMIIGGSGKDNQNWRPPALLGNAEGYRARRFCAVLHLDMLTVNHQKDGFTWNIFELEDLEAALKASPIIKSYLKEASSQVKGGGKGPSAKSTAKNIKNRLGSKSVLKAVEEESGTKDIPAPKLSPEQIEGIVEEVGVAAEFGEKPQVTISFVDQEFGPIMTSCVTGQVKGRDLLRVLINENHSYYYSAVDAEGEKELWIEFIQALALTEHALSDVEDLEFEKIVETLGKILASFRTAEE